MSTTSATLTTPSFEIEEADLSPSCSLRIPVFSRRARRDPSRWYPDGVLWFTLPSEPVCSFSRQFSFREASLSAAPEIPSHWNGDVYRSYDLLLRRVGALRRIHATRGGGGRF